MGVDMMTWILLVAGLLMALISGVFLSFSDFVMRGLAQAPGTAGAAGMIRLNRTVYKSIFMVLFMGLVLGSIALALLAYWQLDGAALSLVVAGTLSYLVGVLAVTGFGNIPMNNRLDATSERSGDMAIYWADYAKRWTRLNHIRTAASAFAAFSWLIAANLL